MCNFVFFFKNHQINCKKIHQVSIILVCQVIPLVNVKIVDNFRLNGPNTYTDWAIEGRRTIPLLPRLKAHTAFTGLANSLSLVIAAANEKKLAPVSRIEDPVGRVVIVKKKISFQSIFSGEF